MTNALNSQLAQLRIARMHQEAAQRRRAAQAAHGRRAARSEPRDAAR